MTQSNNDPEDWRKIIGNKNYKEDLARRFKDEELIAIIKKLAELLRKKRTID